MEWWMSRVSTLRGVRFHFVERYTSMSFVRGCAPVNVVPPRGSEDHRRITLDVRLAVLPRGDGSARVKHQSCPARHQLGAGCPTLSLRRSPHASLHCAHFLSRTNTHARR